MNEKPGHSDELGAAARLALVGATAVLWVFACLTCLPGHYFDASIFIINDPGSFVYAVDLWRAGRLYHDFWWQYGPLGLAWYRGFAAVLGNTPLSYQVAAGAAIGTAWAIIALMWMRALGPVVGWALASAVLLPAMIPVGPNGAVEALLFSALAWVLSSGGGARLQPWVVGALLGLLQWVRFGPHLAAGLAVAAVWVLRGDRPLLSWAWRCAAAYLAVLAPLAAWYLAALPAPGAIDQLWPSFMVRHYEVTYGAGGWLRYLLPWASAPALSLWLALGVGLFAAACSLGRLRAYPELAGLLFAPLFFAFGCVFLFRTPFSLLGHSWMCLIALPAGVRLCGRLRWAAVLLAGAAVLGNVKMYAGFAAEEREWRARPWVLPNGQSLWFHGTERRDYAGLAAFLKAAPAGGTQPTLAVFYYGGGIHHFFNAGHIGRHWWFMPEFVRPWEADEVATQLCRHQLFLLWDERVLHGVVTTRGLENIGLWLPLPDGVRERLIPHLGVAHVLPGLGYGIANLEPGPARP
jgi:hypothetical protein